MTKATSRPRSNPGGVPDLHAVRELQARVKASDAREQQLLERIQTLESEVLRLRLNGAGSDGPFLVEQLQASAGDVTTLQALQKSEARVRRLIESNIIGIFIVDSTGKILGANDAFLKMVDYTREDLASGCVDWRKMTPPEYEYLDERGVQELRSTGKATPFEKEYLRKDGSRVPILVGAAVLDELQDLDTWVCFTLDLTETKRMQRELQAAREDLEARVLERTAELTAANQALKYQSYLLDSVNDIVVATDADFRITAWNRAAEEIFDWRAEEVLGRNAREIAAQVAAESELGEIVEHVFAPGGFESEGYVRSRNGTVICLQTSVVPLKDPYGNFAGIVATARDVTKRKQAEIEKTAAQEALSVSQQRLQALFDFSMDAILLANDEARYLDANPAACKLLGRSREELIGATIWDVTPVQNRQIALDLWKGFLSEGQQESEFTVARPDGSTVEVDYCAVANILPGLHMSLLRDITLRKQAEAALRASEARYRSIFEFSSDGIMLTAPDGSILSANPAACAMLGRTEEEICRLGRSGIVDSSDPRLPGYLEERRLTGHARGELLFVHADGHRFPADMSTTVFRDKDGNFRTSIIIRDISERVKAMAMLEERVEERTRELSALLKVSRDVASTLDLRPLLSTVLAQLRNVVDYTGGAINILSGNELVLVSYDGPIPREKILHFRIPLDVDTVFRRVMTTQKPLIVGNIWGDDPVWRDTFTLWSGEILEHLSDVHSWMGVPLVAFGKLIGMLRLDHVEPNHFSEDHVRMVSAFADHAAVAIQNARLFEKAQHLAAWEERQRLGRDLHDSISQSLYGIALGVLTAQTQRKTDPDKLDETLAYVLSLSEGAFTDMRSLISELQPESTHTQTVVEAISRQAGILQSRHGIEVALDLCEEPEASARIKEDLYRIAREALHNIVKHAKATRVTLRLAATESILELEIADNGTGFNLSKIRPDRHGLRSMRDRTERHGGLFEIESSASGTRLRVQLPANRDDEIALL